ncbi:protein-glutamate methylesterase/protein-glutamine glutaminase [Nocardioides dubius]|uniref:protein-glutamate methylesterase/protein-glutamine glutaminase n=1 Tax=Nocardioides dubius TaxID=317019 RepID=UPI0039E8ABBE
MIRVLLVDDSALVRRLVTTALQADAEISVVGVAVNGRDGVEQVKALDPDLVVLDIEMPEMDGLTALDRIREDRPRLPVIMFSTLTARGARQTLDALGRGASDYLAKPSGAGSLGASIAAVRDELVPKIKALVGARRVAGLPSARPAPVTQPVRRRLVRTAPDALLIGCSTGGPDALAQVLSQLPAAFGLPIAVVQHMPPVFTGMLAQRLDGVSALRVREAAEGDVMEPGQVLVAPGDRHLRLRRVGAKVSVRLTEEPPENFCRPAVDVLFRSALEVYGGNVIAVILTGMGQDGLRGTEALAARGAQVLAQDQASSVVWGMPGAVVGAGLANEVLALPAIPARLRGLAEG